MTNGEKIKELFPSFDVEDKTEYFGRIRNLDDHFIKADIDFWNAEYKKPTTPNDCETCIHNKGVLECDMYGCKYEPTTKNDLGVDCISRAQTQTEIEMNASRYTIAKERGGMGQVEWSDQLIKVSDAVDIIRHLPSVTPQERTGHWVGHWIPTYGNVECSVCGSVKDSRNVGKATHYCDFCGAKMESEDKE